LPANVNKSTMRIVTPSGGDVTDPPAPSVTGTDPGKGAN
jgi:hypothetical protein